MDRDTDLLSRFIAAGMTAGQARLLVVLKEGVPLSYAQISEHMETIYRKEVLTDGAIHSLLKGLRKVLPKGLQVETIYDYGLCLRGLKRWLNDPTSRPLPKRPGLAWQREEV